MPKILLLETATEVCSVGLWEDDQLLLETAAEETYQHTSALTILIQEVMAKAGWSMSSLDAVAVSSGPGSYTALRVGAATAKGICFAGDIPMIAVDTLDALAGAIKHQLPPDVAAQDLHIVPMIDARRMEVYGKVYSQQLENKTEATALIIDQEKLQELKADKTHLYLGGNGAEKCRPLLQEDMEIIAVECAARHLGPIAREKFGRQAFEDIAYFNPNYLKPPNITKPKPIWN